MRSPPGSIPIRSAAARLAAVLLFSLTALRAADPVPAAPAPAANPPAGNPAPAAPVTSATFSVLNQPEVPIGWGGVLSIGVAGQLAGPAEDAKKWSVSLNGVAFAVAKVMSGPGTDLQAPQPDERVYRLVLARLDFSSTVSDKNAGDVAAATIQSIAPQRWGSNTNTVQLTYGGTMLKPRTSQDSAGATILRNLVEFRLAPVSMVAVGGIAILLLVAGMILAGARTAVLRDDTPAGVAFPLRLYSLGRTQLAFWTTLVVGGYLFLYLTTGQFWGLLNDTALTLLGISVGTTALSAAAGTATPSPPPPAAPQTHVSFLTDILSDANGTNIHRLQMVIWTVVFGLVFVKQLVTQFAFPQFDGNTYILMGISSATYIWFKRTES